MPGIDEISDAEFNKLVSKAGELRQRREQILATIAASEQRIAELEKQAVASFGEDYMIKFSDAVLAISTWESQQT